MSNKVFQKSIAASLGLAIASTGLFFGVSGQAQNSGTTIPGGTIPPVTVPGGTIPSVTVPSTTIPPVTVPTIPGTTTTTTTTTTTETPAAPAGTTTTPAPAVAKTRTIVDIASKDRRFKTLVTALKAADLVDTLAGTGPFTVFAPTDAAFAKIPKKTLANLLKPENKEKLKAILTYHVVSGAVTSDMLKAGKVPTVLSNASITVRKYKSGQPTVNGTSLKKGNLDIKASNGVVHIIDTVLMPPTPKK